MSIHTHETPRALWTPEVVAPALTDWAVVAKVIKLDAVRAAKVGEYIMNKLGSEGSDAHEQLLAVDQDESGKHQVTTFTYSLPDYPGHQEASVKSALFDGISYTEEGIRAMDTAGLIVAVRLARWRDLMTVGSDGETDFDTSWDKLEHSQDATVERLLEASGHGLAGLSH